jgi:hypothetical protein
VKNGHNTWIGMKGAYMHILIDILMFVLRALVHVSPWAPKISRPALMFDIIFSQQNRGNYSLFSFVEYPF